jgi:hypothetical protein
MRNTTLMLNTLQPPAVAQCLSEPLKAKVLVLALFIVGLMLTFAPPAQAQEIPDWAAPGEQAATDQRALPNASDEMQDPPPFPTPLDPVGLAWLAVAGGALAARRLRHAI